MKMTTLLPGIDAFDRFVLLTKSRTLVVGDVHLGYEEMLGNQGVLVHARQAEQTIADVMKAVRRARPARVVLNGDITHEFKATDNRQWRSLTRLLDEIGVAGAKIELVRGNHDTFLPQYAKRRGIPLHNALAVDDIAIVHGDKERQIPAGVKSVIIGHEHPAIALRQGARRESYKCFLAGRCTIARRRLNLVVMPSFFAGSSGTDLLVHKPAGPLLTARNLPSCSVYVVTDEGRGLLPFGTLKALRAAMDGE